MCVGGNIWAKMLRGGFLEWTSPGSLGMGGFALLGSRRGFFKERKIEQKQMGISSMCEATHEI